MLTLNLIKENPEEVIARLAKKHFDGREAIEKIIGLDKVRRAAQAEVDKNLAEVNSLSKSIGMLMKEGKKDEAEAAKAKVAELKELNKKDEAEMKSSEEEITQILYTIPNLPHSSVPEGRVAEDNVIEREGGPMPHLLDDALPHWDIAKKFDLIDFELGVKITGAGFPVYKGKGARLQRALINFFLDNARDAGYLEVQPPYVVNEASGYGTGQLPDKRSEERRVGKEC